MARPSIIFVDDEGINLLAFQAQFRREYSVACLSCPQKVLEHIEKNPVDVVFSDQRMPGMKGTELLALIADEYPEIRRAIISGFTEDKTIMEAQKAGVVERAFEKPYRVMDIKGFIDEK